MKGNLIISKKTKFTLDEKSQIIVEGDADFSDSEIYLENSALICKSLNCNQSSVRAVASKLNFETFVHFKNSHFSLDHASIEGKNHFRVHHYSLRLAASSFKADDYFMCDGNLQISPTFELLNADFKADQNVRIQAFVLVHDGKLQIGNNSFVNSGSKINCQTAISIGNYVMISYDCAVFDNNSHSTSFIERRHEIDQGFPNGTQQKSSTNIAKAPVFIGDDVWIGMRSMVLKGIAIQSKSIIAAGTIVTKDLPENHLVFGPDNKIKPL
ncbi:MAG TPA: acyltransferase [Bacteroidia bacterium]|nr:acyltransferase [Bacteroidia bacterium]